MLKMNNAALLCAALLRKTPSKFKLTTPKKGHFFFVKSVDFLYSSLYSGLFLAI